jgi:CDP-glucose 4,6-dehydratase
MEYTKSTVEGMVTDPSFWKNRTVLVTGHTGFKGGWLSLWLSQMGAKVYGYSLNPPTTPNFFTVTNLQERLEFSEINDIRNLPSLCEAVKRAMPSVIIHMAAQPIVRDSYSAPVDTFSSNVMGTVNVLEAARQSETVEAIVSITTDKCYENQEWIWSYRENEKLGGYDPYSSSKACAELVTAAYRNSFFAKNNIQVATARAGNVIGGGDWANDRLIPDFLRALDSEKTLTIRYPQAIRPWQHVLEPLSGYLLLAENLVTKGANFAEAWNFGPSEEDSKSVSWIVEHLFGKIEGATWEISTDSQHHEAGLLKLDSSKAKNKLGWKPRWCIKDSLDMTYNWHQAWRNGDNMSDYTIQQIDTYIHT